MDDKVIPFRPVVVSDSFSVKGAPVETLEAHAPGEADLDTTTILEHHAALARRGDVAGCLVVTFDPKTRRFSHAFCTPPGADRAESVLALRGFLDVVAEDMRDFAREVGDYRPFDPKELA